jgi:tripartite-type tricarboxylate transporter receptor subunit TctC
MSVPRITRRQMGALGLAAGVFTTGSARADTFPSKPIHLIVPFTPGGTTDVLAREIAQKLQVALGQTVIVENRPGAGGSVGCEMVARSEPDGCTLLMGHIGTLSVNPSVYPHLGYDPVKGWSSIAWTANVPNVLAVHASVPATSVKELVALAKSKPGVLAYGTGGNGTASHIATAYFATVTGIDILHVPYKGTAPFVVDLVAGLLQIGFSGTPSIMPHVKTGQLRALGVSSAQRSTAYPELPTVAESGYPGFEADQWYGITGPAGIDPAVVARLNAEINKAMDSKDLRARLAQEGGEPILLPPQALTEHIATEIERWKPVLKAANVKLE